jgi:hypothetical protein
MTEPDDAKIKRGMNQLALRYGLPAVCLLYLVMAGIFASVNLDVDEFGFIRDPYELLGGDYTVGYLKQHRIADAVSTALKSYYFYWTYRPLYSPLIPEKDKMMFDAQERDFGYTKPASVSKDDQQALTKYGKRFIVPEPDRFYSHGAGKPLLSAIASIPQLVLLKLLSPDDKNLLYYQYRYNYHGIFIVVRLAQILAGLATVLLVYWILAREYDQTRAVIGAAAAGLFPTAIEYFPNLHHDSILAPFLVLSLYFFFKEHYKKAGLFLGLALATKNVAIFMLPVFAAQVIYNLMEVRRAAPYFDWNATLGKLTGPLKVVAIGVLVLVPFANPISYAREILTPVTHRVTDLRGENVEQATLSGRLGSQGDQTAVVERPDVRFLGLMLRLESNDFFFLAIAVVVFYSTRQDPLMRMCFLFLLISLPYGLIFGYGLNYRSLQFVPFFALLVGRLIPRQYAIAFVSILLLVDVVYCIDPITANEIHIPVNHDRFWLQLLSR